MRESKLVFLVDKRVKTIKARQRQSSKNQTAKARHEYDVGFADFTISALDTSIGSGYRTATVIDKKYLRTGFAVILSNGDYIIIPDINTHILVGYKMSYQIWKDIKDGKAKTRVEIINTTKQ